MKKLLLVLMVVALASFLMVGCLGEGTTPDDDDEDDGGGGEVAALTVEIGDSVDLGGKTYVSTGSHTVTVTFAEAVTGNVGVDITGCTGDYKSASLTSVVMFPDPTGKIWTGSGDFGVSDGCCASYVEVSAGDCGAECVTKFPVIVDGGDPYALITITADDCSCAGCGITFESEPIEGTCEDTACCGDDCSGLTNWSITLYDEDPFDECCLTPCVEPIGTCSGTGCEVDCTTTCLETSDAVDEGYFYAVVTLADAVGNETEYYARILLDDSGCVVTVNEGLYVGDDVTCVDWTDTGTVIGTCAE